MNNKSCQYTKHYWNEQFLCQCGAKPMIANINSKESYYERDEEVFTNRDTTNQDNSDES